MLEYINELLNQLGHNILLTTSPVFYWDGEKITENSDDHIKMVSSFQLTDKFTFKDFIQTYSKKKIVLYYDGTAKLTDNNNILRVYIN